MGTKRLLLGALKRHGQRRLPLSSLIAAAARAYLDGYENNDYDMARNGEVGLLRRLAPLRPRLVFDVGANRGEWSRAALEAFPEAALHAFEIAPPTAAALAGFLGAHPRCTILPYGLGEAEGRIALEFRPGLDVLTTRLLDAGIHAAPAERIEGRIRRGDAHCAEYGIDAIDLLKIDVEGGEPEVLDGFGAMLAEGRIGVIQFEYGMANITSRVLLRDFHARLGAAGYEVGKLYPHGVAFAPWRPEAEDFRGPNHVAVHRSRPDWRAALAA
ncbi:FkbM family methyltransferase [Neoroseomonas rubea]|uniref:FkbM family methyltransferase n=1 Tax=Neoroseomonas rubea TaxID=2748666 RepID=UPI0018E01A4D|nr:FkbM family methyltransferase [Roseomonas rubea]